MNAWDDLNDGRNPAPMGPREENRLTIVLNVCHWFSAKSCPYKTLCSNPSRLHRAPLRPGVGGKGRGARGPAAASVSWQAARALAAAPGSLRLAAA